MAPAILPEKPNRKKFIASQCMISVEQFLALLEEKDLLPKDLLAGIRNRVAQSPARITAVEVSQMLIAEGYFTPALANHFLGEAEKRSLPSATAADQEAEEKELGFAQLNEEPHPRILRGKLLPFKLDEKEHGATPSAGEAAKPHDVPVPVPQKTILDKPSASPWSTSVYERETDSYKGLVSYRLAKLAEAETEEKIPPLPLPRRRDWSLRWIAVLLGLGLLLFICLFVWILLR